MNFEREQSELKELPPIYIYSQQTLRNKKAVTENKTAVEDNTMWRTPEGFRWPVPTSSQSKRRLSNNVDNSRAVKT